MIPAHHHRGKSWGGGQQHKFGHSKSHSHGVSSHSGGGSGSNHHKLVQIKEGDIFAIDSPKAYAPLGYGSPGEAVAIQAEDFKNDVALPSYGEYFSPFKAELLKTCLLTLLLEERAPIKVSRPLGATFIDTETQRPSSARLARKPTAREDQDGGPADPVREIVLSHRKSRRPLLLGKTVLSEDVLGGGTAAGALLAKRVRDSPTEPSASTTAVGADGVTASAKKRARTEKTQRDNELYTNEDTVRPENVLMMVDSSLVDTPERRRFHENKHENRRE